MEGLFFLYPFILFILLYCPAFEVMQGKEQDFRNGRIITFYPFILFILSYCPAFEVMQGKEQDFRNGRIIFSLSFHSVYPVLLSGL